MPLVLLFLQHSALSDCCAPGDAYTTVTDVYGSVEAFVVSAGFVGHGNENSLGYPNKPPAEPACNCQFSTSQHRETANTFFICCGRAELSSKICKLDVNIACAPTSLKYPVEHSFITAGEENQTLQVSGVAA